ncbi:MAG: SRPBCC family protein [Micromonosporaceae bacterium]
MSLAELTVRTPVDAPAGTVWRVLTDWERQSEWMVGTTVRLTRGDGHSIGSELAARTGVGPVGFTDTMEIIMWEPPRRCEVLHTGRLVRGVGSFTVEPASAAAATVVWTERLDLPLGVLGRWGWPLVRPAFRAGVRRSLTRLARLCE